MKRLPPDWFLRVRLKLRHLQLFLALDEHRNLHRAAASLDMSQPAASKLLGELEDLLGVTLFDRLPRGVEPNWYGDIMIRRARMVLSELTQAGEELTALQQGNSGATVIGTVTAPAVELVVAAIDDVGRSHPRLQISVQVDNSDTLVRRLLEGALDFAIARIPHDIDPTPFQYEELTAEELCFVCRDGHPLLTGPAPTLADLAAQTWTLHPRGTLLRRRIDALFQAHRLPPPARVIETASVMMAIAMIGRTDALTAVARAVADLFCTPGRYAVIPWPEALRVEPFGIITLKDRPLSPGGRALLQAIRRRAWPDPAGDR